MPLSFVLALVFAAPTDLEKAKAQAASAPRAPIVARETFLRRTDIVDVKLSPAGSHVSFLRRVDGGIDVMLQDVSTGKQTRVVAGLQQVETAWSGDGRRLWVADQHGLSIIDAASLFAKRIRKWDAGRSQRLWSVDPRATQHAIMQEKVGGRYRYLSVDVTGRTRLLIDAALPLRHALLNPDGSLAFTAAYDGARYETVVRQFSATGVSDLKRCSSLETCKLVGYNEKDRALWLLTQHGEDKLALLRWRNGTWETVHRDPKAVTDADEVVWSQATRNWLAISYHDGHRSWYGNDSATRTALGALKKQLPNANLQLSPANDRRVWLVQAQQAESAYDRFYMFRADQNKLQPILVRETNEMKKRMPAGAAMHPVSYRARDGMLVHGYVLLPSGVAARNAPLVAWVHGGPITRVYDRYDGGMQLLVNRGYAVFVPNFRASTGYGLKYVLAANGDVGNGRVLADIIDGLDYVLAQGIGDRKRQAIMGMSFGGYASLLALSHHPTRFRFAFAGAPPTEYGWIKQWQAEHDSEALRPEGPPLSLLFPQLGFPYKDAAWRAKMQRESPFARLAALQAPVYIWAGVHDDHVPLKSIVSYVGEAQRLQKPLNFLIDPDGGHSPRSRLGVEASLYMIELAAHRHLGGPVTPISPELQSFMRKNVRVAFKAAT